jgi:hypothetical protein
MDMLLITVVAKTLTSVKSFIMDHKDFKNYFKFDFRTPVCPVVNFINVKRAIFLYGLHFGSIFSSYMYVVKTVETTSVQKICTFNVDEIDTCTVVLG